MACLKLHHSVSPHPFPTACVTFQRHPAFCLRRVESLLSSSGRSRRSHTPRHSFGKLVTDRFEERKKSLKRRKGMWMEKRREETGTNKWFSINILIIWSIKCQKKVKNAHHNFLKPKVFKCLVWPTAANPKLFSSLSQEKAEISSRNWKQWNNEVINYFNSKSNIKIVGDSFSVDRLIDWLISCFSSRPSLAVSKAISTKGNISTKRCVT